MKPEHIFAHKYLLDISREERVDRGGGDTGIRGAGDGGKGGGGRGKRGRGTGEEGAG